MPWRRAPLLLTAVLVLGCNPDPKAAPHPPPVQTDEAHSTNGGLSIEDIEAAGISREELRVIGIQSESDLEKLGTTELADEIIRRSEQGTH